LNMSSLNCSNRSPFLSNGSRRRFTSDI
jgi:hypothetical protein